MLLPSSLDNDSVWELLWLTRKDFALLSKVRL
jgi:hypothetical protein